MVYIIGSNLESQNGAASADIVEMVEAGVDTSKANVVLYTGGAASWATNISNSCNSVYELTESGFSLAAKTEGPVNMGEASTLGDFLNFAYENYPAKHYGLICWDHGAGPVIGYGMDELYAGDGLSLAETEEAMKLSPFDKRNKLQFA